MVSYNCPLEYICFEQIFFCKNCEIWQYLLLLCSILFIAWFLTKREPPGYSNKLDRLENRFFGGYPFLLWLRPVSSKNTTSTNTAAALKNRAIFCRFPEKYTLYLYPDDLQSWFVVFAITISLSSASIGPGLSWWWPVLFIAGYCLGFFLLFHVIRLRCLSTIIAKLPSRLEEWILGYVERIDIAENDKSLLKDSHLPADVRLKVMLTKKGGEVSNKLRIKREKRYISRLNAYHPQEWMLRIAITTFFQKPGKFIPSTTFKVLFYWGAPVWIGYCLLFLPLLCLLYYGDKSGVSIGGLVLTLLVWVFISTFFALIQTKKIAPSIAAVPLARNELDHLPIVFQTELTPNKNETPDYKYFNNLFTRWIMIINFSAFTLFVLLIEIVE